MGKNITWNLGIELAADTRRRTQTFIRATPVKCSSLREKTEIGDQRSERRDGGHSYGSFLPDSLYMRIFYNFLSFVKSIKL